MTRIPISLVTCIVSLNVLIACNNNAGDKKTELDTASAKVTDPGTALDEEAKCPTSGNFLVTEEYAKERMADFRRVFKRTGTAQEVVGLADSFWIDACVIKGYQQLCSNSIDYDGFRIYSIQKKHPGSTEIILVPTTGNGQVEHHDQWGKLVSVDCRTPAFRNYNLEFEQQELWTENFQKNYRGESGSGARRMAEAKVDSLSRGMWMSECVLNKLMEYLDDGSKGLDGIRIYSAAYDKIRPETGAIKDIQSTFMIVVTSLKAGGGHDPRWDIIKKKYTNLLQIIDGLNHGQLCPTVCD